MPVRANTIQTCERTEFALLLRSVMSVCVVAKNVRGVRPEVVFPTLVFVHLRRLGGDTSKDRLYRLVCGQLTAAHHVGQFSGEKIDAVAREAQGGFRQRSGFLRPPPATTRLCLEVYPQAAGRNGPK